MGGAGSSLSSPGLSPGTKLLFQAGELLLKMGNNFMQVGLLFRRGGRPGGSLCGSGTGFTRVFSRWTAHRLGPRPEWGKKGRNAGHLTQSLFHLLLVFEISAESLTEIF